MISISCLAFCYFIQLSLFPFFPGIYVKHGNSQSTNTLHNYSCGDLASGRAFDSGCVCHQSNLGMKSDLMGDQVTCSCGVSQIQMSFQIWAFCLLE